MDVPFRISRDILKETVIRAATINSFMSLKIKASIGPPGIYNLYVPGYPKISKYIHNLSARAATSGSCLADKVVSSRTQNVMSAEARGWVVNSSVYYQNRRLRTRKGWSLWLYNWGNLSDHALKNRAGTGCSKQ
ncbi:hypothetical protein NQ317_016275 [Molorchus minor]|uniref:Uncharacterized protein n=1 Tax=Molorchus minor TaxID=1323400 RepID=A0ABQ9JYK3_9CUCU|nr:hypothetical protein NQ317_016275 [Molorchus minor]